MTHASAPASLISVVIPTYNSQDTIAQTLASVLAQTHAQLEIFVVDDGSVDNTCAVCESIADPRVHLIRMGRNMGGGVARNRGIEAASGRYIALLDADDIWLPQKLADQLDLALCSEAQGKELIIYNAIRLETEAGDFIKPEYPLPPGELIEDYITWKKQYMQTSGLLVDAGLLKRVRFDDTLRKHQDIDLILALARAGGIFVFCSTPNVIYKSRLSGARVSLAKRPEYTIRFLEKWRGAISPTTRAYYLASIVAPMLIGRHPLRAVRYFLSGLPQTGRFLREFVEAVLIFQISPGAYNKARAAYRGLVRKRPSVQGTAR